MAQGNLSWNASKELSKAFGYRNSLGQGQTRLALLASAWEREVGHFDDHWKLEGVRKGVLYVRTKSPAGAQELALRSTELLRAINKYFQRPWLKAIRNSPGQRFLSLPPEARRRERS